MFRVSVAIFQLAAKFLNRCNVKKCPRRIPLRGGHAQYWPSKPGVPGSPGLPGIPIWPATPLVPGLPCS